MGKFKNIAIEQSEEPGGQRYELEKEKLGWRTIKRKVKDLILIRKKRQNNDR